jgi:hypothetical protein
MHINKYIYIYIFIYIHVYTYMYIYLYLYIYIYTSSYTYIGTAVVSPKSLEFACLALCDCIPYQNER